MKTKYVAAFALLAWLLVAAWLSSMVIAKPAVLRVGNQADESAEMLELRNRITRNRQTLEALASLRGNQVHLVNALPVAVPAAAPMVATSPGHAPAGMHGATGESAGEHAVSVVLVTNGRRSAVVDGQHVGVGSRLGNGSRVVSIGTDWVRIVDASREARTYHVPNPLAPGQAGSPQ